CRRTARDQWCGGGAKWSGRSAGNEKNNAHVQNSAAGSRHRARRRGHSAAAAGHCSRSGGRRLSLRACEFRSDHLPKGEKKMFFNRVVRRVAVVGTGVIGASWSAEYLARGVERAI